MVATGSSALRVGSGSRESLAGRFERVTLTPPALAAADEVFVSSTIREVMPVTSLVFLESSGEQKRLVADGKPGPVAQRLRAAFRRYVEQNHGR